MTRLCPEEGAHFHQDPAEPILAGPIAAITPVGVVLAVLDDEESPVPRRI
jgi:hypothetical protein